MLRNVIQLSQKHGGHSGGSKLNLKFGKFGECPMDTVLNNLRKATFLALGATFFVVGVIGVILPFLPGTPFFLLSALCFKLALED
jgi:hypothetical protein